MSSNFKTFKATGITARLFELISRMTEQEQRALFAKIGDQRLYERIPYLMQVDCETANECFCDFILDLSPGGIFLETVKELALGEKVALSMTFRTQEEPFLVSGRVAWKGINGVGVQFEFDTPEQQARMEKLVASLS